MLQLRLRIATLLALATAVQGACDVACDGFDDDLMVDMTSLGGMFAAGDEDDGPGPDRRHRLLEEMTMTGMDGEELTKMTCKQYREQNELAEDDTACAMGALLAYHFCGCATPPADSCYVCADGSPVPDLDAAPDLFGMEMDEDMGMAGMETCGDLALQASFSQFFLDAFAEGMGEMAEGLGGTEGGGQRRAAETESEACVPVNHQYDRPGELTCDCVASDCSCLTEMGDDGANCIPDEACAGIDDIHSTGHASGDYDMDMGDMGMDVMGDIDMCAMVGMACGCPADPDACVVCPFGLLEPEKVLDMDGEAFTCEQGVQMLTANAAIVGMDCDAIATLVAEEGCPCATAPGVADATTDTETGAGTTPAEVADVAAPEEGDATTDVEAGATTTETEDGGAAAPPEDSATDTGSATTDADDTEDASLGDSSARAWGTAVGTLVVAAGAIALA